ncbi:LysM peptidoglycan-binding domain-containing protein [Clostridiaceae bacterium M8S5]|nr:LysM peptidoglycan-binding domain-containing protein [Clostridiaceae bacterium M8S5]
MKYNIFINNLKIPVLPEEINVDRKSNNDTTNVLGLGEISRIKSTKLREVSFKSFFPKNVAPYVVDKKMLLLKPSQYVDYIEAIRKNKIYITLRISGAIDIDMNATIEKFSINEKGGEPGDIYYDIAFKEYKNFSLTELQINDMEVEEKNSRQSDKDIDRTYTVKKGDCLWKIAKRELGDGSKWRELAKLNNIKAKYVLQIGQVIKLK